MEGWLTGRAGKGPDFIDFPGGRGYDVTAPGFPAAINFYRRNPQWKEKNRLANTF